MPDQDRKIRKICTKALKILAKRGFDKALRYLDRHLNRSTKKYAKAGQPPPIDLLTTRAQILRERDDANRAVQWILEKVDTRSSRGDREQLLDQADPLIGALPDPELLFDLWLAWCELDLPDRSRNVSRQFETLERARQKMLHLRFQDLRRNDAPEGDLGLAHLCFAIGRAEKSLPFLRKLANLQDRSFLAAHAVVLLDELLADHKVGADPDSVWTAVEIHLNAGDRGTALRLFGLLFKKAPQVAAEHLETSEQNGLVPPDEAEDLLASLIERAREHPVLRQSMIRRCRAQRRLHEASKHLLVLADSTSDPEELTEHLREIDSILVDAPEDLELRAARTHVLCRAGKIEEFLEANDDILRESPEQARILCDLWRESGHPRAAAIDLQHARTLAGLERREDAVCAIRDLADAGENPEGLLATVRDLVAGHEDQSGYSLLMADILFMAREFGEALRILEGLVLPPAVEADRVHAGLSTRELPHEAGAHTEYILARCCLEMAYFDESLDRLETLAPLSKERLCAALEYAMNWRQDWISRADWARRVVVLLFRADMMKVAVDVLADASRKLPDSAAELLRALEDSHVIGRREFPVLKCRFDLLLATESIEAAVATAMAIGEGGEWEGEYQRLNVLVKRPGTIKFVANRLLATSIRLKRPVDEILRHGATALATGDKGTIKKTYEDLSDLHRATPLTWDGVRLLGLCATELGLLTEATEHFQAVLDSSPAEGSGGLATVLERDPGLIAARVALASFHLAWREFGQGLSLLEDAPERTEEIWSILRRYVAFDPPHHPSWELEARWLENQRDWDDLVTHLRQMVVFEDADLPEIDDKLQRMSEETELTPDALWLRTEIARRLSSPLREIKHLHALLAHGDPHIGHCFETMDELRDLHPNDRKIVLEDLRLAAAGLDVERVIAAARTSLDGDETETEETPLVVSKVLQPLRTRDGFESSRGFLQALYDSELGSDDEEHARDTFLALQHSTESLPHVRYENCMRWRRAFGSDRVHLKHEVRALIDLDQAPDAVGLIREIAALGKGSRSKAFKDARDLALEAARASPDAVTVRRLASDLAAQADDEADALDHALGALRDETADDVVEQLISLSERFETDVRFDLALAHEIYEESGALELASERLAIVLDRDRTCCDVVLETASRIVERQPTLSTAFRVRSRASVLFSSRGTEAADRAVAHLQEYLDLDSARSGEILGLLAPLIKERPEHRKGRFLEETLLRNLDRAEEAVVLLEKRIIPLVESSEDRLMAMIRLAKALEETRDYERALTIWRRCREEFPEEESIPRRIRQNFLAHRRHELENPTVDEPLWLAYTALWAGNLEKVFDIVTPCTEDAEPSMATLALRGAALLATRRHEQLRQELLPNLERIPRHGPLSLIEKEFLFALGRSAMFYDDHKLARRCLERLAQVDPVHRAVRVLLDHHYAAESRGNEPPIQFTLPLEETGYA